ncbi:MAG: hypothetical protein ABSH48_13425 [Verrucomicrobiota bacterium]
MNDIHHFPGFVYEQIRLHRWQAGASGRIEVIILPHAGISAKCSRCHKPAPGYDQIPPRSWQFVPLRGLVTWFIYAARGVKCQEHGVVVEHVPWSGAEHFTFGDPLQPRDRVKTEKFHPLILAAATAFWKARLRDDPAAKGWLEEGGLSTLLNGRGKFRFR